MRSGEGREEDRKWSDMDNMKVQCGYEVDDETDRNVITEVDGLGG